MRLLAISTVAAVALAFGAVNGVLMRLYPNGMSIPKQ